MPLSQVTSLRKKTKRNTPFRRKLATTKPQLKAAATNSLTPSSKRLLYPQNILVVDDDQDVKDLLILVLSEQGYRVSGAPDGQVGWMALQRESFDVLITDYEMPELNGVELLRRVRHHEIPISVILISASLPIHLEDLPTLMDGGRTFEKPFSIFELIAEVRTLLT